METFLHDNLIWAAAVLLGLLMLVVFICIWLLVQLRRLRRGQKTIIGEGEPRDLVEHSRELQQRVEQLAVYVDGLEEKIGFTGRRVDDCLTFRSVIRYDAYRDLSGMQSTSVALLDTRFSGMVISSIQGRDHARIYVKEIFNGESKEQLMPEELHVLKEAMGGREPNRSAGQSSGGEVDD